MSAGRLVGDLHGEVVALAELLAHDLDDVLGVASSLAKISVFGTSVRPGKISVKSRSRKVLDDRADLVLGDDGAVELVGGVGEVVVELLPARLPGLAVAEAASHRPASTVEPRSVISGADPVDVEVDVDAVGDRLLVAVLHDEVLVEEAERLLRGRGGEADQEGVEVFEHLPPEVVDGAVALVDDDDVEGLDAGRRGCRRPSTGRSRLGDLEAGALVELLVAARLAAQDRVEALDGGDGDAGDGVEAVRGEVLDVVELGELAAVVGRGELLELLQGLAAEVGAVDQEEDAPRAGVLDEAVG